MDQGKNKEQLKYLEKPTSDINSLRDIFSEEELKIINKPLILYCQTPLQVKSLILEKFTKLCYVLSSPEITN